MEEDFKAQQSATDTPQEGESAKKPEEPRKETWYYHIPSFREEHLRLKAQYENEKRQIKELVEKLNSTKEQIDNDKAAESSKKKQKSPKEQMKREKRVSPSHIRKKRK